MLPVIRAIHTFREIRVPVGALVVLDIDDTVMRYQTLGKSWWKRVEDAHYAEVACRKAAEELTLNNWIAEIQTASPSLIQEDHYGEFLDRIETAGAKQIFLTARRPALRSITEEHLRLCGIPFRAEDIHFNHKKGETLAAILADSKYSDVLFVDDMRHNLESVAAALEAVGCRAHLYHFLGGGD